MNEGWFVLSRRLINPSHDLHPHSTGEPVCRLAAWADLIGLANWKDAGGLQRGQLNHSERFLAVRWNRPRSWVQRFLEELEEANRISREPQTGRKPGHITICNYNDYQDPGTTNGSGSRSANRSTNRSKEEGRKKKEGSRRWRFCPDEWSPTDKHEKLAEELGVDLKEAEAGFRDHEFDRPKSDPDRTFNNWLRNQARFQKSGTANGQKTVKLPSGRVVTRKEADRLRIQVMGY